VNVSHAGEGGGERARVLFLAKLFPWPLNLGARQRVFHLARGIAAACEVTVVAFDQPRAPDEISSLLAASGCTNVIIVPPDGEQMVSRAGLSARERLANKLSSLDQRLRSPLPRFVHDAWSESAVRQLVALRKSQPFDLVYATQSWTAEQARSAGFERIVVDVDDLISSMSTKRAAQARWNSRRYLINRFDAAKEAAYERSLPRRFAHVVIAKDDDLAHFRQEDRARVSVVPNGVTLPPRPLPAARDSSTLLFVGTLGYGPNIDAIAWLMSEIMPLIWERRPDVRLMIAGFGSGAHLREMCNDARCELHESPPDLAPLYEMAAVVLAPIRTGGGTRIKVLEALAMGRALVCTEFAAEGLGLSSGVDLEYADSGALMAARTLQLLADPEARNSLAAAGRAQVAARFDWVAIERSVPPLIGRFTGVEEH
jgi:polysaccharide biosynthesis protein PslH